MVWWYTSLLILPAAYWLNRTFTCIACDSGVVTGRELVDVMQYCDDVSRTLEFPIVSKFDVEGCRDFSTGAACRSPIFFSPI